MASSLVVSLRYFKGLFRQTAEAQFSSAWVIRSICKSPAPRIIDLDQTAEASPSGRASQAWQAASGGALLH